MFAMVPQLLADDHTQIEPAMKRMIDVGAIHHDEPPRGEGVKALAQEAAVADV